MNNRILIIASLNYQVRRKKSVNVNEIVYCCYNHEVVYFSEKEQLEIKRFWRMDFFIAKTWNISFSFWKWSITSAKSFILCLYWKSLILTINLTMTCLRFTDIAPPTLCSFLSFIEQRTLQYKHVSIRCDIRNKIRITQTYNVHLLFTYCG